MTHNSNRVIIASTTNKEQNRKRGYFMRTITTVVTTNVYTFNELTKKAKERVRQDYLSDEIRTDIFSEDCMNKITELFPNSDLKIQYSLNSCQGDGFNIYGEIFFKDLMEVLKDKFTKKEENFLKWAFEETGIDSCEIPSNHHYCYCIASYIEFAEEIFDALEYYDMKNIKKDILEKMEKETRKYFQNLCREFENEGYDFFYNVSDDELEDWANMNEYEFTEDGKIF